MTSRLLPRVAWASALAVVLGLSGGRLQGAGAYVQSTSNANGSSASLALPFISGTTINNLIVVCTRTSPAVDVTNVDHNGVALTQGSEESNTGDVRVELWYGVATSTSSAVTMTAASASAIQGVAYEFGGTETVSVLDAIFDNQEDASTSLAGNVNLSTSTANAILVTCVGSGIAQTFTTPTSYAVGTHTTRNRAEGAYRIVASTGIYDANWGMSAPDGVAASHAAFKIAAGGGTPAKGRLLLLGIGD